MMLIGTVLLGLLPGVYYLWWSRHMSPRPEDRTDATSKRAQGSSAPSRARASGPSSSAWGLRIALAAVFGIWLLVPAFSLVFSAAIGYTAESRRGGQV